MTKVAVVTGASSGIGRETAKALAAQGWDVIGLGRDPVRSAAAEAEIRAVSRTGVVDFVRADLSLVADAACAAREIVALTDRIDVLIDNAGGITAERQVTREGNEATFAANHLGPFVLTDRLLPVLRATAVDMAAGSVRIVVTSSLAHEGAPGFDWTDPQMLGGFQSVPAYANAKLANLLFTRALARRLDGTGITVNSMHPGIVASNFASHAGADMKAYFESKAGQLATPAAAADTLVWLALSEEARGSSGGYFENRRAIAGSEMSRDPALADRLWAETETIVRRVLA